MNIVKTENYKRFKIEYWVDEYSDNPREWDNVGKMVCFHKNYIIGDKHDYNSPDDLKEFLKDNEKNIFTTTFYYKYFFCTKRWINLEDSDQRVRLRYL